jgi:hypothetical protein
MPRAFVIRPFGVKKDSSGQPLDFDAVHRDLIEPALIAMGFSGSTTIEIESAGNIRADMFALILEADVVVCDITVHNANVFYELGVRHALRKRGTIMLKGAESADTTPFDLMTDRYLAYSCKSPADAKPSLIRTIEAIMRGDRIADSPVFAMMPELPEVDPTIVRPVPIAFTEEVVRAAAAESKGWLRLLAEDVRGRRFERAGLRMVGAEQWRLKDLSAAQRSLEAIREFYPDDVDACLALASVYERLAKQQMSAELLVKSDQCVDRALSNAGVKQADRVEALTLRGRNLKTLWRWQFEHLPIAEARVHAMNQQLIDSYRAYHDAFQQDQNHYWSGLGALQMGRILLELSTHDDSSWRLRFDTDADAECFRTSIERDVDVLQSAVRSSIDAAFARLGRASNAALWARVSVADLMFASNADDDRTFRRYEEILPELSVFDWDSVRGQLALFKCLGFRPALAERIIAAGDGMEKREPPKHTVVVFAGHQPDRIGRQTARFPESVVASAKEAIRTKLAAIKAEVHQDANATATPESPLIGLASGAPGGDVLFHEVCAELKIPTLVCLPIPTDKYVGQTFEEFPVWRSRFLNIIEGGAPVLELSDRAELPSWLAIPPKVPAVDFWERGNRWVLAMAQAFEPKRAYLLALWDGKPSQVSTGGSAHMAELVNETKLFRLEIIDPATLAADAGVSAPAFSPTTNALAPSRADGIGT